MINRFAIAKYNHGFVLTDPNNVPVSPANRPSDAYARASGRDVASVDFYQVLALYKLAVIIPLIGAFLAYWKQQTD